MAQPAPLDRPFIAEHAGLDVTVNTGLSVDGFAAAGRLTTHSQADY